MREAQDCVPASLLLAFLKLEQQVLTSLLTLSSPPLGLALIIVWKTLNYNYIRYFDFGTLVGLCDMLCGTWNKCYKVMDRIATSTDIKRLMTLQRFRRKNLIDKAFGCASELEKFNCAKLSCFLVTAEEIEGVRHVAFGTAFPEDNHLNLSKQLARNPQAEVNHMDVLQTCLSNANTLSWTLEQQMKALNCLPSQNGSFAATRQRKYTVSEGRFRTSCKSLFIRGCETQAIYEACIAVEIRRQRIRATPHDNFDDSEWNQPDEINSTEESDSTSATGIRTPLNMTLVEKYKSQLQRAGFIRIRNNVEGSYDIIWNKYDVLKGSVNTYKQSRYQSFITLKKPCLLVCLFVYCV